jgi:hypothetical protein
MSELSNSEIDALLKKIRDEYKFYSNENSKIFKVLQFEERYTEILKSRGNLSRFFHEEIQFLEKLKKMHKENQAKLEIKRNSTIDKVIEGQEASIKHYRKIDFHPYARNELKYFYGALLDYCANDLLAINRIYKGTPEMRSLQDYVIIIERIGLSNRNLPSSRITEHIKIITAFKGNLSKIEQDTQAIIKDTCIALKKITIVLQDTIDKNHVNVTHPMVIDEKDSEAFKSFFGGLNFGQAINKIIQNSNAIIADFRMDGILDLQKKH